ncbi:MAG TPA: hypothetical protein VFQ38_07750 [Longimicrobiales bacterium]|nr:hypothetical protein [Longimicrobiales bacterium]
MHSHTTVRGRMARLLLTLLFAALPALAGACGGDPTGASGSGAIHAVVVTTGAPVDPDGYTLTVGARPAQPLATTDSVVVGGLAPGATALTLDGVAGNCVVTGGGTRSLTVYAGDTVRTVFEVGCADAGQTVRFVVRTTGFDLDPDGYELSFRGAPAEHVAIQDTLVVADVPAGERTLVIGGLSRNCQVKGGTAQAVAVAGQRLTTHEVRVRCGYLLFGGWDLTLISPDGEDTIAVTTRIGKSGPADEYSTQPAWSPDGRKIAVTSTRNSNQDIYVYEVATGAPARLTNDPADDRDPAWSPDGSRIAFVSYRIGGEKIWIMNADGSDQRLLPGGEGAENEPAWSPDGQAIAYTCGTPGGIGICVMRPDGTDRRIVHAGAPGAPMEDHSPAWSPDGRRIVFSSHGPLYASARLYVVNADGSGWRALTPAGPDRYADADPVWTQDGDAIVFSRWRYDDVMFPYEAMWLRPEEPATVHATGVPAFPGQFGGLQPR